MATDGSGAALRHLQELFQVGAIGGLTDGQLLDRFARRGDASAEAAFAILVERHGPMVLGVCRHLLGNVHEAEDAFQATFLVLARKAALIREPELLANWLYGVAHRTAMKVRAQILRRRGREAQEAEMSTLEVVDRGEPHDEAAVQREQAGLVYEELGHLPEKQRAVVVLCCLEELTIDEASRRLRCTPGAVRGRLAQARSRLKARLIRRGVAVPSAVVATALSAKVASAAVSPALRDSTTGVALRFASGVSLPGNVAALANNVSGLMLFSAWKLPAVASLVAIALAASGIGVVAYEAQRRSGPETRVVTTGATNAKAATNVGPADQKKLIEGTDWLLSAVDPDRGTISLDNWKGHEKGNAIALVRSHDALASSGLALVDFKVAAGARIIADGQATELKRLHPGMRATVALAPDRFTVISIQAESLIPPATLYVLEKVDIAARTISVSVSGTPLRFEKIRVDQGAKITLIDARPDEAVHFTEALQLKDVQPGMPVSLTLGVDHDGQLFARSLMFSRSKSGKEPSR